MKSTVTVFCSILFAASFACGGRDKLERDEKTYEVVQEGAGGNVTGTLQAPGEAVPPPMPALTGTNADTTTAFTLPNTATSTSTAPPGSIAGTFPQTPSYPTRPMTPQPSAPRPVPQPEPQQPPVVEPPPPAPAPPSTDTTATQPAEDEPDEEPEPQPAPPTPPPTSTGTQQPTGTS